MKPTTMAMHNVWRGIRRDPALWRLALPVLGHTRELRLAAKLLLEEMNSVGFTHTADGVKYTKTNLYEAIRDLPVERRYGGDSQKSNYGQGWRWRAKTSLTRTRTDADIIFVVAPRGCMTDNSRTGLFPMGFTPA